MKTMAYISFYNVGCFFEGGGVSLPPSPTSNGRLLEFCNLELTGQLLSQLNFSGDWRYDINVALLN